MPRRKNRKELIDEKPPNPVRIEEEKPKDALDFLAPGGYAEEELKDPCIGKKPPKLDEKTRRKTEGSIDEKPPS